MNKSFIIMTLMAIALVYSQSKLEPVMQYSANYVFLSGSAENDIQKIVEITNAKNGYVSFRNNEQVHLKIPTNIYLSYCDSLEKQFTVITKESYSNDIAKTIFEKQESIRLQTKLLQDYFTILNNTTSHTSLQSIEREIIYATNQLEQDKGALQVLLFEAGYAFVVIHFKLPRSYSSQMSSESVFPWINQLGVHSLLKDFTNAP
jgi:hypothetical protein